MANRSVVAQVWITFIAIFLGAELDAEIEHQTAQDSTVGTSKPLGARGATMADEVGAARFIFHMERPAEH